MGDGTVKTGWSLVKDIKRAPPGTNISTEGRKEENEDSKAIQNNVRFLIHIFSFVQRWPEHQLFLLFNMPLFSINKSFSHVFEVAITNLQGFYWEFVLRRTQSHTEQQSGSEMKHGWQIFVQIKVWKVWHAFILNLNSLVESKLCISTVSLLWLQQQMIWGMSSPALQI